MNFFSFSSKERSGIIILFLVCSFIMLYEIFDVEMLPSNLPALPVKHDRHHKVFHRRKPYYQNLKHTFSFFEFDPNSISFDSLIQMGFSAKQAQVVVNYRNKDGRFRTKADFAKLYFITDKIYNNIEPFIKIDSNRFIKTKLKKCIVERRIQIAIDINSATIDQLISLPFIGTKRAEAIMAYREKLGGFYEISQLKEIPQCFYLNVDSCLKDKILIDVSKIQTININTADYATMKKHPYFRYYTIKKIIDYRNLKGVINTPFELIKNKIIDSVTYKKILPYITI